jgi:hypothetical protein
MSGKAQIQSLKKKESKMKIKLNADCLLTVWITEDHDVEEFRSKGEIFKKIKFLGMATSFGYKKFPQFQFGDGSVFILERDAFTVLESDPEYDAALKEE